MLPGPDSLGQTSELWDHLQLRKFKVQLPSNLAGFELECCGDLVLREQWHS